MVGWLGQQGFAWGWGELKYLKRGGTKKRGGDTKILKRGGKLGQGVGTLKRGGGLEPPYELCPFYHAKFLKILTADPELWECAIFGPKMAHFPKWSIFLENLLMSPVFSFMPIYMPKIKVRY